MTLIEALTIGAIRGVTEVLPLGAAGHLALLPAPQATPDQMAATNLAANVGVLVALALYFWRDMAAMGVGLRKLAKGRPDPGARLFFHLLEGSVAAAVIAAPILILAGRAAGSMAIAATMAIFGLALLAADYFGITVRRVTHLTHRGAIFLGALQAAALMPGVSRTGIVITALRLMGYERGEAARFSVLLAVPLVLASSVISAWRLDRHGNIALSGDLLLVAVTAGLAALAAIAGMMAWLRRGTYGPFALWRIALGMGVMAMMAVRL